MDPELEALLKSFDAFIEARGGSNERELFSRYRMAVRELAVIRQVNADTLMSPRRENT